MEALPTQASDRIGVPRQRGGPPGLEGMWLRYAERTDQPYAVFERAATELPRLRWANRAFAELVGIDVREPAAETVSTYIGDAAADALSQALHPRRTSRVDIELICADGRTVASHAELVPVHPRVGQPAWICRFAAPSTAMMADQLIALEHRFRALSDQAPVGIVFSSHGLRLGYVNATLADTLSTTVERLLGLGWLDAVATEDRERVTQSCLKVLSGANADLTLRMVGDDGSHRRMRLRAAPVTGPDGAAGLVGTVEDVTERLRREEQLAYQASHDSLTGLINRTRVNDALHAMLPVETDNIALLLLDLDDFKSVNDSLGHDIGDQLLVEVAHRLREAARSRDIVGRLGGDEFVVVCHNVTSDQEARAVAGRLLQRVSQPVLLGGASVDISASVGVVRSAVAGRDPATLLRAADVAMYQAKQEGKARFTVYDPTTAAAAHQRLMWRIDLRRAISDETLDVHYQPIVDVQTGVPVGVEALARWTHPEHGFVPPSDFIPLAEATGLIVELGQLVLRRSCEELAALRATNPAAAAIYLSVNLSPLQLSDDGLPAYLRKVLRDTKLQPADICLEITESALIRQTEETLSRLAKLSAVGVQLALDDFGTGYSALSYLPRLPVSHLKLDRAFVADLDGDSAPIAAAVVGMARALGLGVIAEGVETERQALRLAELGYRLAQGYRYSKPLDDLARAVEVTRIPLTGIDGGLDG